MAPYTSKAVAEVLGVTERRVRELRDEGVLSEERPGIFNMKTVVKQYLTLSLIHISGATCAAPARDPDRDR